MVVVDVLWSVLMRKGMAFCGQTEGVRVAGGALLVYVNFRIVFSCVHGTWLCKHAIVLYFFHLSIT